MVRELSVNDYFVRPAFAQFGIYRSLDENRAHAFYLGTESDCDERLRKIHKRVLDIIDIQFKNKDYIFNLMMENMQRVTELKADLDKEGLLDFSNIKDFSTENEMFRDWCEEYEFEIKMIEDPEDMDYLDTSEKFFKQRLLDEYGKELCE